MYSIEQKIILGLGNSKNDEQKLQQTYSQNSHTSKRIFKVLDGDRI